MHYHDRHPFFPFAEGGPAGPRRSDHPCQARRFAYHPGPHDGGRGRPGFRGGPRGPRVRPGDLRLAVLALLAEEARNGYGMIQEIAQRSGGLWQPSPGSMYPALSQLEDEGLITLQPQESKKTYALTEAGRTYVRDNAEALKTPWQAQEQGGRGGRIELRASLHGLMGAVQQVAQAGSEAQVREAATLLDTARKALYRMLAGDAE